MAEGGYSNVFNARSTSANPTWDYLFSSHLDGIGYVIDKLMPCSDILIVDDTNHGNSSRRVRDFFAPQTLARWHEAGVTDVYLENGPVIQGHINVLASGLSIEDDFVRRYTKTWRGLWITPEQEIQQAYDLARAIVTGANMVPPVRFHAAQIPFTPEEKAVLSQMKHEETMLCFAIEEKIWDYHLKQIKNETEQELFSEQDIDSILAYYASYREKIIGNQLSIAGIIESARTKLVDLNKYTQEDREFLEYLKHQEAIHRLKVDNYNTKFRTFRDNGNDELADFVLKEHPPKGKSIVVHGSRHSDGFSSEKTSNPEGKKDLDEFLLEKGGRNLSVSRVTGIWGRDLRVTPDTASTVLLFAEDGSCKAGMWDPNHRGGVPNAVCETHGSKPSGYSFNGR